MNPNGLSFQSVYNLFASHPEGQWVMYPDNANLLYKFIKEHPVKRILELGTGIGCSTAIMALALEEKGEGGEIHTVEQTEKCHKLSQELMPQELKKYVTWESTPTEAIIWQTEMIPYQYFSIFKELPEGPWDLILVDGPGPWVEGSEGEVRKYIEIPNGDVIKMLIEDKLSGGTFIAWDGRLQALRILERYFGDNFYLVQPSNQSQLNIIERKDNPLSYSDMKLLSMKEAKYF